MTLDEVHSLRAGDVVEAALSFRFSQGTYLRGDRFTVRSNDLTGPTPPSIRFDRPGLDWIYFCYAWDLRLHVEFERGEVLKFPWPSLFNYVPPEVLEYEKKSKQDSDNVLAPHR